MFCRDLFSLSHLIVHIVWSLECSNTNLNFLPACRRPQLTMGALVGWGLLPVLVSWMARRRSTLLAPGKQSVPITNKAKAVKAHTPHSPLASGRKAVKSFVKGVSLLGKSTKQWFIFLGHFFLPLQISFLWSQEGLELTPNSGLLVQSHGSDKVHLPQELCGGEDGQQVCRRPER